MAEKPKIVLLKDEEIIVKPGEQPTHVGRVFSNDPNLTQEQIVNGFGQMGINAKPRQEDVVGRELNKRGFGLSETAKKNWDGINWGHN